MAKKELNVQKLDILAGRLKEGVSDPPLQIRETIETWRGKGWGMRFERQRTETTIELKKKDSCDER